MALAPALVELGLLVIVLWIIALAALIAVILGFIAGGLRHIPAVGGALGDAVQGMASGITNACASAFRGTERAVAWSWHTAGRLLDFTWHEFESALITQHTAAKVAEVHAQAINQLAARWRSQRAQITARSSAVSTLEREFKGIDAKVREIERELHKGIGNDVRVHIKALERELNAIEENTIPAIQTADSQAHAAIDNLYQWAAGKASLLGIGTIATAVGAVVATLGNGWLGCKNNPFSNSKDPCGLWGDLARFLPFLGLLTIAFNFEEFTDAAIEVADGIGSVVAGIEGSFETALPPLPPPN